MKDLTTRWELWFWPYMSRLTISGLSLIIYCEVSPFSSHLLLNFVGEKTQKQHYSCAWNCIFATISMLHCMNMGSMHEMQTCIHHSITIKWPAGLALLQCHSQLVSCALWDSKVSNECTQNLDGTNGYSGTYSLDLYYFVCSNIMNLDTLLFQRTVFCILYWWNKT